MDSDSGTPVQVDLRLGAFGLERAQLGYGTCSAEEHIPCPQPEPARRVPTRRVRCRTQRFPSARSPEATPRGWDTFDGRPDTQTRQLKQSANAVQVELCSGLRVHVG